MSSLAVCNACVIVATYTADTLFHIHMFMYILPNIHTYLCIA